MDGYLVEQVIISPGREPGECGGKAATDSDLLRLCGSHPSTGQRLVLSL